MSSGIGRRRSSDPTLLWRRPVATAPIRPLALEPPYAAGAVLKRQKKKKKEEEIKDNNKCNTKMHQQPGQLSHNAGFLI